MRTKVRSPHTPMIAADKESLTEVTPGSTFLAAQPWALPQEEESS